MDDLFDAILVVAAVVAAVYGQYGLAASLLSAAYGSHDAKRRAENAKRKWEEGIKDLKRMVKAPDAVRGMVLGRERVSGPILFADSYGSKLENLKLIIAVAGHEVDAIETIYFNDLPLTLDGFGFTLPNNFNLVAQTDYVSEDIDLTAVVGLTTITIRTNVPADYGDSQPSGWLDLGGALTGTIATYTCVSIHSAIDAVADIWTMYDNTPKTASFTLPPGYYRLNWQIQYNRPAARVRWKLGAPAQTASASMITDFPTKWSAAHKLTGIAYLEVDLFYIAEIYEQVGIPNVSAVVRGAKVFDWTTSTTAWSDNAAKCIAYWLTHPTLGLASSQANDFIVAEMQDAQSICAEQVGAGPSITEDRYTVNGAIFSDTPPATVKRQLEEAIAGSIVWSQGRWLIRPGKYRTPALAITESDVAPGGFKLVPSPSRQSLFNRVVANYLDPAQGYASVGAPEVSSATYLTEDNGVDAPTEVTFPFVKNYYRAIRLAKYMLVRNRNNLTISVQLKLTAYDQLIDDTVTVTWADYGLNATPFEVKSRSVDFASRTISLLLTLTGSTAYDWLYTDYSAAVTLPALSLPSPTRPAAITGLAIAPVPITNAAQVGMSIQRITWTQHPDIFVTQGGSIDLYHILPTGWRVIAAAIGGGEVGATVYNLPFGAVSLAAVATNARGQASNPTFLSTTIGPDTVAPTAATSYTAVAGTGGVTLSWADPRLATVDYKETQIRVGAVFASSTFVKKTVATSEFIAWPASGSYTYWVQHFDWSGNASTAVSQTVAVTTLGTALDWTLVDAPLDQLMVNRLDASTWGPGVNGWTTYSGGAGTTAMVRASLPTGEDQDVWEVTSAVATLSWQGGPLSDVVTIDPTKAYRYMIPVRRTSATVGTEGNIYIGVTGSGGINGLATLNTTTEDTNPYLLAGTLVASLVADRWYYLVTYIYPAGTTGNTVADSGLYDSVTGARVFVATCWNFVPGDVSVRLRHGLYRSIAFTVQATVQFGKPMFSVSDGRQQNFAGLLASFGTTNYRNSAAPTNNAAFGTITAASDASGNIVANIPYTYTQGALPADLIYVYYKEGGGAITAADPATQTNPVTGSIQLVLKASTAYTFGLQAGRRVDSGVLTTAIVTSSTLAAVTANYTANLNGTSAATVATAANNFNTRNDRNATALVNPTWAADGTAIDHTVNEDGSVDLSIEWNWAGTNADIDGFYLYIRQGSSATAYTMGTSPAQELVVAVPAGKRAAFLYGMNAVRYYTFAVQAYRIVDSDISASGLLTSTMVQQTLAGENPYQPATNVAFAGNVTGTVNGIAASNVNAWAAISGNKPIQYTVGARGGVSTSHPTDVVYGVRNSDTGTTLLTSGRSYNLVVLDRATSGVIWANSYDVYGAGAQQPDQQLLQSNVFTASPWASDATAPTLTGGQADAYGTGIATKLAETATTSGHNRYQTVAVAAGTWNFNIEVKAAERTWARLTLATSAQAIGGQCYINLSTGVVSGLAAFGAGATADFASAASLGSGWYRVQLIVTFAAPQTVFAVVWARTGATPGTYLGTAGSGIFISRASLQPNQNYITYRNTTTAVWNRDAAALASDLTSTANSTRVIVLTTFEEPQVNRLTGGLPAVIYANGGTPEVFGNPSFAFRSAYMLIAVGGCGQGNGAEFYRGSADDSADAWVVANFTLQNSNLIVTGNTSSGVTGNSDLSLVNPNPTTTTVFGSLITKIGGIETAWGDSGPYSKEGFRGGAYMSFTATGKAGEFLAGLNTDPATDQNFTSLDWSWYIPNPGVGAIAQCRQNGSTVLTSGITIAAGDIFAISYDGAGIRFLKNGVQQWPATGSISVAADLVYYFDCSLLFIGTMINNVRFTPYGNPSAVSPSNPITAANITTFVGTAAIQNAQIGNAIQSSDFDGTINGSGLMTAIGTRGWAMAKGDGSAGSSKMVIDAAHIRGQLTTAQLTVGAVSSAGAAAASTVGMYACDPIGITDRSGFTDLVANGAFSTTATALSFDWVAPAGATRASLGVYSATGGTTVMEVSGLSVQALSGGVPTGVELIRYPTPSYYYPYGVLGVYEGDPGDVAGLYRDRVMMPILDSTRFFAEKASTANAVGYGTDSFAVTAGTTYRFKATVRGQTATGTGLYFRASYRTSTLITPSGGRIARLDPGVALLTFTPASSATLSVSGALQFSAAVASVPGTVDGTPALLDLTQMRLHAVPASRVASLSSSTLMQIDLLTGGMYLPTNNLMVPIRVRRIGAGANFQAAVPINAVLSNAYTTTLGIGNLVAPGDQIRFFLLGYAVVRNASTLAPMPISVPFLDALLSIAESKV